MKSNKPHFKRLNSACGSYTIILNIIFLDQIPDNPEFLIYFQIQQDNLLNSVSNRISKFDNDRRILSVRQILSAETITGLILGDFFQFISVSSLFGAMPNLLVVS